MIAYGHPPDAVWKYTPRQAFGFLELARTRKKQEYADLLSIMALASRGESKELQSRWKELTKDG